MIFGLLSKYISVTLLALPCSNRRLLLFTIALVNRTSEANSKQIKMAETLIACGEMKIPLLTHTIKTQKRKRLEHTLEHTLQTQTNTHCFSSNRVIKARSGD